MIHLQFTANHFGPEEIGHSGLVLFANNHINLPLVQYTSWVRIQERRALVWQGEGSPSMAKGSSWSSFFSSYFVLLLPSLIHLIYSCCKFTYAIDTLFPGQFLTFNQSLVSKSGVFTLGSDCGYPSEDYEYCGLAIWFANSSSSNSEHFPVWIPFMGCSDCSVSYYDYNISVSEEGVLHIDGGYDLNYYSSSLPYKKNSSSGPAVTSSVSAVAVLLDNGNLVIRDKANSSMVIWQSFDSPTYMLLPGARLGLNTVTGKNVTLVSYVHSPVSISYTLSLDATRRRGFIIRQDLGGRMFSGTFPEWMDIHEEGNYALTFNHAHRYMHLTNSGIIRLAKQWDFNSTLWSAPEIACGVYAYCGACDYDLFCGPYSLCTSSHSCTCPIGFDPPWTGVWNGLGCTRKVPLNCESNATELEVTFHPIDGILRYPHNAWPSKAKSMRECESSCLRDCTCSAFAYNSTCLLWFWELQNTVVLESGSDGNRIYIRTASNQQQSSFRTSPVFFFSHKRVVVLWVIGVLALILLGFILLWRCRRNLFRERMMIGDGNLKVFSYSQIKKITKNFSEKLGEGGFGCVFRGTIVPVSAMVAVKRLKCFVQGDKQFRAEVQTLGMIQHTNLVRLLGFCADEDRRLLVYEYMVNGCLNSHLFCSSSAKLSWELRYSIALGTARGLAYLHEECEDCIVHCDLKPDNILLDELFCPKIADFGMAKLLGRDYSRVLTTMRGTIGYLAPEWISGVPITHKADVYSYGMMLLEIISGRRNSEKIKEGRFTYFPIYAAVKVNEGDVMCLLDSSLEGNADAEQLKRICRVACWCIQDSEDHRPTMGQVVRVLEGVVDVDVPPVPRSLEKYVGMEDSISADLNIF